jgi:diguanylate cyclase (GGDEF)-like protein
MAALPINYMAIGHPVLSDVAAGRRLHQFAYYDHLTGLPNRHLFMTQLKNFVEHTAPGAEALVFQLDINNLKKINDTLGHSVGDQVLRMVARRLEAFCKRTSSVARWGGDEFTLLVRSHDTSAQALAQHVLDILAQPLNLGHQEAFLSKRCASAYMKIYVSKPHCMAHWSVRKVKSVPTGKKVWDLIVEFGI